MLKMSRLNPCAKLISNLIVLFACFFVFDPQTTFMIMSFCILLGLVAGSFNRRNLKAFVPLSLFAFAMLWMNAAWARVNNPNVIGTFGPLKFTDKGFIVGLSLCFRVLTIGVSSILFITNTEPTELILSLIKQFHLNPAIAYGMLTAIRFLPSMETDLLKIKSAHRVRGDKSSKWYLKKSHWYKAAIPLLAVNVRKAERVSIAMEARGFESSTKRTYYKTIYWKKKDTAFVFCTMLIICIILLFSHHMGWLVGFRRWQGF